jgi:outer membrane biosynthesis protein TonB
MGQRLSPRFGFYVTVIVLAAVVAILVELGRSAAIAVVLAAWIAAALVELAASRRPPRPEPVPDEPEATAAGEERQPDVAEDGTPPGTPPEEAREPEPEPQPLFSTVPPWRIPESEAEDRDA